MKSGLQSSKPKVKSLLNDNYNVSKSKKHDNSNNSNKDYRIQATMVEVVQKTPKMKKQDELTIHDPAAVNCEASAIERT